MAEEKRSIRRKPSSSATFSIKNATWTGRGIESGLPQWQDSGQSPEPWHRPKFNREPFNQKKLPFQFKHKSKGHFRRVSILISETSSHILEENVLNKWSGEKENTNICALWGIYAAQNGSFLPTFRDNLSVPSSEIKQSKKKHTIRGRVKNYPQCRYMLCSWLHCWLGTMRNVWSTCLLLLWCRCDIGSPFLSWVLCHKLGRSTFHLHQRRAESSDPFFMGWKFSRCRNA
jgi:hypothetical protein